MSVFRLHKHEKGFALIDNESLRDSRLSFRARGILGYLLSQPEEFQASSEILATQATEGREAVRTAMRELEAAGYLQRERVSSADGRWATVVHVHERPEAQETEARKPVVGLSSDNGASPQVAPRPRNPNVGKPGDKGLKTKNEDLKTKGARAPANGNGQGDTAAEYVALFVNEYRRRGTNPPKQWLSRVGKACREMLAEETDLQVLTEAVRRAAAANRPGSIVYKVADIELERAGGKRAR